MTAFTINVSYSDDRAWVAQVGEIFDEGFYESDGLEKLVAAIAAEKPWRTFVFVIDYGTIEDHQEAEEEFRRAAAALPGRLVLSTA